MKSLPRWLSTRYSLLYVNKDENLIRFEEVKKILNLNDTSTLKTLSELAKSGALITKRDPLDERQKIYKLISPEDFHFAQGVQASLHDKASLLEKIKHMGKHRAYIITGDYAVLLHTKYVYPATIDIKVKNEDYAKWYAYLRDPQTHVALEPAYVKQVKKYRNVVNLTNGLTEEEFREKSEVDGLFVETIERLILHMVKDQNETSLSNAMASAVVGKNKINWEKLAKKSTEADLNRQIGCFLEILNIEAKRNIFPQSLLEMFTPKEKQSKTVFSTHYLARVKELETKTTDMFISESEKQIAMKELTHLTSTYKKLEKKWNLEIILPTHVPKKIVQDLVH